MTGNSSLTTKNWKNEYFWSVEGQNQKMNSKFSVFLGSLAVKMKTLRESFRDRCKLTEWESLQVWASYVAMRARKKQKPSQFSVPASCCSNWLAACTQPLSSSPAWHPIFFRRFFRFFFVFSMRRSFFRILFLPTPSKTHAVPASRVWHRWVTLSSSKPFFSIMSFLRGGWPVLSVFLQSPWFFTAVDIFSRFFKKSCTKLGTIEKVLPKSRNFAFFRGGWATLVVKFENYMQKAFWRYFYVGHSSSDGGVIFISKVGKSRKLWATYG